MRFDHKIRESDSIFFAYSRDNSSRARDNNFPLGSSPTGNDLPSGFGAGNEFGNSRGVRLGETHVFSPAITNEFRPGYTRFNLDYPVDAVNPLAATLPQITIQGINTSSQSVYGVRSTFPQGRIFNNYVIQDTMTIVRGAHNFRFGTELMDQRARQVAMAGEADLNPFV